MTTEPSTSRSGVRQFRHLPESVATIDPGCNAFCDPEKGTHVVVGYTNYDDLAGVQAWADGHPRMRTFGGQTHRYEITGVGRAPEAPPHPDPDLRFAWYATYRPLDV